MNPVIHQGVTINLDLLRGLFGRGLRGGAATHAGGQLCVEQAVALALGEPLSDKPGCVAGPDRDFAIRLNDAAWPSEQDRADAMWPLALAQLGTTGTDRGPWVRRVVGGGVRRIVPIALRAAAWAHPDEAHRQALSAAADRCASEGTREAAMDARSVAIVAKKGAAAYAADDAATYATYADAAAYAAAAYAAADAADADAAAPPVEPSGSTCCARRSPSRSTPTRPRVDTGWPNDRPQAHRPPRPSDPRAGGDPRPPHRRRWRSRGHEVADRAGAHRPRRERPDRALLHQRRAVPPVLVVTGQVAWVWRAGAWRLTRFTRLADQWGPVALSLRTLIQQRAAHKRRHPWERR